MFRKLKDIATLYKALGQYEELREEIDTMPAKSLFTSRTFWVNALTLAATFANILPEKFAFPTLAVVNIGLRLVTSQPVTIPIPFKN